MTAHTYSSLAHEYGTPLYVYDLDRVVSARRDLFEALPERAVVYYALKANPHPEIASVLRRGAEKSCRAEISSTGELSMALSAGFRGSDCLYSGPGKTSEELDIAVGEGVRTFSVESVGDLRRIGRVALEHNVVADCLLRVNGVSGAGSTSIRMTGTPSQFGLDIDVLPDVMGTVLSVPGTRVVGAHFFPLSNAASEGDLLSEFKNTIEAAAHLDHDLGLPLRRVDLGGGFAAPYAVVGSRPRYQSLRGALEKMLDQGLPGWRTGEVEIAFESGRYLVADSGTLITSVTNIKETGNRTFAIVDAGINSFGGMAGLGRILPPPVTVERVHSRFPAEDGEERGAVTVVGPLCTPGDVLARNIVLPRLREGDLLAVPNVGAYGATASLLSFLGRPAPREVVLRNGTVQSVSRLDATRTFAELEGNAT